MKRVIRKTEYYPVTGTAITSIYMKTCFGKKLIHRYKMEATVLRTLGYMESGLPSVQKAYGDIIGISYIYKKEV